MSEQLTVARLRALLADLPDDLLVHVEGCDCVGTAHDVERYLSDRVLICRDDDEGDDFPDIPDA